MGVESYSTTPASNTALFPEGMAPSAVNDGMRQVEADLATWYLDPQFIKTADTPVYASATTFTVSGDKTAAYSANRRIKCYDSSTAYASVVSSSYSNPNTTVTLALDSGSLSASLSAVALSILTPSNISVPHTIGRQGVDIASASTTDLGAASGDYVHITGTTTITALGTANAGREVTVRFTGALTLTHNATSLILPGSANITTASGDTAIFRSEGSGNWICINYKKADGTAVVDTDTVYFELIGSATANNSASITVSGLTSTYIAFKVIIQSLSPVTDNTRLLMRLNGISSANYLWANKYLTFATTPTESADGSAGTTSWTLSGTWGNGTNDLAHGIIEIIYPNSVAPVSANWMMTSNDGVNIYRIFGGGHLNTTSVSSVTLLAASGNLSSGTMHVYGIRAS